MNPIILAFITGLTTGGVSCLAVQGGLLASAMSQQKDQKPITIVSTFLIAKVIAYTILGFLLGFLGSTVTISSTVQGWMQIIAGLYMLTTAANLLNLHPIFRYFVIQPPRFAYKLLKNQTKAESLFAPALLGFLTVLIPCGITQAMMLLAISSGNALLGAGILAAFTLGTTPIFAGIGAASTQLFKKKSFVYLASIVIIILAISSINAGQNLRGSRHTLASYWNALSSPSAPSVKAASIDTEGKQEVTITVLSSGYQSNVNTIKAGVPVKLTLITNNTQGCSRAFTIPTLNVSKVLPLTGVETIEFTPTETGRLAFTCSMGMFSGEFKVI
jgi:uncharacterized protein